MSASHLIVQCTKNENVYHVICFGSDTAPFFQQQLCDLIFFFFFFLVKKLMSQPNAHSTAVFTTGCEDVSTE